MTKAELKQLSDLLTPDEARQKLKTLDPNLPERCRTRLAEIYTRRVNGGELTMTDGEFLVAMVKAGNDKIALEAACKGSNNTNVGVIVAWSFLFGTLASVAVVNIYPKKRRLAA